MALDFTAVLPDEPYPSMIFAAIPLQAHAQIIDYAGSNGLKLLARMDDYWSDAVYGLEELPDLRVELSRVRLICSARFSRAANITLLLERMDDVIEKAQQAGGYVEAIAD